MELQGQSHSLLMVRKRVFYIRLYFRQKKTAKIPACNNGVGRKRPEKQGCHEMVVAATIAPTVNACRSRTDPGRDLRFAAYPRVTVYSNRAKFGKLAYDSF